MIAAPTLLDVLAAELDRATPDQLDRLADRLSPLLDRLAATRRHEPPPGAPRWLTTREAAAYVGLTVPALHKLTAARSIPFEQEAAGCKLWFRADELDAWRRGEWRRLEALGSTTTTPSRSYRRATATT
jgi:excisionase family DNA binding protein